jgi:hypothetical protein
MTTKLPPFRQLDLAALADLASRLVASKPPPPPPDPRADAVALILAAGRYRRAETQDNPSDTPEYVPQDGTQRRRDKEDDEPEPGSLVLDAIRRQQESKK